MVYEVNAGWLWPDKTWHSSDYEKLMNSVVVLYASAGLMAFVAVVCSALCLAWSIPSWRLRLSRPGVPSELRGLTGWSARVGSGVVSIGIAACAVVAGFGCYCVLADLMVATQ